MSGRSSLSAVRRRSHPLLGLVLVGLVVLLVSPPATMAVAAPAPATPTSTARPPRPLPPLPGRGPGGTVVGGPRLASRGVVVPPGAPKLPKDLTAHGWVLADLDSGRVLAARDAHGRYPPASTLKTLTALTLLPRLPDRRRKIVASALDANIEGSKVGLVPQGRYTVDILFQSLLLMSGNDAANALARAAGGVPRTVALMNAEAHRIQAFDTHAVTPSGLDGPGQATSAYDLALIARAALRIPDFRRYVSQRNGKLPAISKKAHAFAIANQNKLLYFYPGAFGVKTGFTDAARHTYIGAAARHGRRLVVTFLHCERRPIDYWQQAAALLNWGFALPPGTPDVGTLVEPVDPNATGSPTAPPPTATSPAAAAAGAAASTSGGSPVLPLAIAGAAGAVLLAGVSLAITRRRRA
jgi:serine-type D-Ala-D-Ala carboxypeptidase (penicillin-binding protein 5/6)